MPPAPPPRPARPANGLAPAAGGGDEAPTSLEELLLSPSDARERAVESELFNEALLGSNSTAFSYAVAASEYLPREK